MTTLQLYDAALIEQNKLEAPTLTIEEYNYLINKAIIQYINLRYAAFDVNQQMSDDLRWLQRSVELSIGTQSKVVHPGEEANYVCVLPTDYFHILNCTVHFAPKCGATPNTSKCKPSNEDDSNGIFSLCRRLTANQFPAILQNAYLKPSYKMPYFYINTSTEGGKLTAENEAARILDPCISNICDVDNWKSDILNEEITPNAGPLMEIRCGKNKGFYPDSAFVDYLKIPEKIHLTYEQVKSSGPDTSPNCEFPDAVAYEIINIFVRLLFENAGDERLQTHYAINQTVGGFQSAEKD